jgi:hypothetical protein
VPQFTPSDEEERLLWEGAQNAREAMRGTP